MAHQDRAGEGQHVLAEKGSNEQAIRVLLRVSLRNRQEAGEKRGPEGSDGGQKTAFKTKRPGDFCVSKHGENKPNSERYPRTAGWGPPQ